MNTSYLCIAILESENTLAVTKLLSHAYLTIIITIHLLVFYVEHKRITPIIIGFVEVVSSCSLIL